MTMRIVLIALLIAMSAHHAPALHASMADIGMTGATSACADASCETRHADHDSPLGTLMAICATVVVILVGAPSLRRIGGLIQPLVFAPVGSSLLALAAPLRGPPAAPPQFVVLRC
jgi:hypothetical protein